MVHNKGTIIIGSARRHSIGSPRLWVRVMGRGGVSGRCGLITWLGESRRTKTETSTSGAGRHYCGGSVGSNTRPENRLPRGEVLSVHFLVQNWDSILLTNNVKICLVSGQEWVTRQEAVIGNGGDGEFIPRKMKSQYTSLFTSTILSVKILWMNGAKNYSICSKINRKTIDFLSFARGWLLGGK